MRGRTLTTLLILVGLSIMFINSVSLAQTEQEMERFLQIRKWAGTWYDTKNWGNLDASLEMIRDDKGTIGVIYAWSDSPIWGIEKGRWTRKAQFYRDSNDRVVLFFGKTPRGNNFEFYLDKDGNLIGKIVNSTAYIKMHPVK